MQIARSGYPMERVAVDIMGELPVTERGNKYVLVVSDYFTKWTECYPMNNMEAATVAKLLVEQLFSRFGIPEQIHSDQGRQFESKLFYEMCELLQIDKTRTTPYHPQSDGMVERYNKTLCSMLRAYIDENHSNWDLLLPYVTMAYRATEHESTGASPNMLMFGHNTRTPLDLIFQMPPNIKQSPINTWLWELQDRLESVHRFVRENIGSSILRQKKAHDRRVSFESFNTGDHVLVYFPVKKTGQTGKFASFWKGPYKVSEKLSDVLLKINCGRNGTPQVVHIDRVRKIRQQILPRETETSDLSDQDHAQAEIFEGHEEPFDAQTEQVVDAPTEQTELSENAENADPYVETRYKRVVRKPRWMRDYLSVFSLSREMPNTKQIKRTQATCPTDRKDVQLEKYMDHAKECRKTSTEEPKMIQCDVCFRSFKKVSYMKKHKAKFHPVVETVTSAGSDVIQFKEHKCKSDQKDIYL
ncbi:MAG: DDE-type integrase/transposase/recombinase [Candidatus Thiodiazotropha endolucinida]|nr:DDE-type integrase/transposase/recombinase [Candidatus Thiodiazotropha taylori]MCW4346762.1 DDE-type integrase/transposase/recombinase [Candidatus Thiodiazotropha endolucinida]